MRFERGFAHVFLLLLLLVGLGFGVYLVGTKTNWFSKASSHPISSPVNGSVGILSITPSGGQPGSRFTLNGYGYIITTASTPLTSNSVYVSGALMDQTRYEVTNNGTSLSFELSTEINFQAGQSYPVYVMNGMGTSNIVYLTVTAVPTQPPAGGPVINLPDPLPDIPLPPIFNPQPTPTVIPTPTVNYMGACANSAGNGPDGIKCELGSYYSSSDVKCTNKNLYPYYYTRCTQSTAPQLTPVTSSSGACANSAGYGPDGISCKVSSYLSGSDSKCTNKNLYPYYFSDCTVPSITPTPAPSAVNCPSGTIRKECIGYSSNGINQYCWGTNNVYLGGTCNSQCPAANECSR